MKKELLPGVILVLILVFLFGVLFGAFAERSLHPLGYGHPVPECGETLTVVGACDSVIGLTGEPR